MRFPQVPLSASKSCGMGLQHSTAQTRSPVSSTLCSRTTTKAGSRSSYGSAYAGDGATFVLGADKGFKFGEDGAFHGAFEYRDRQPTNRAGLTGVVQYPSTEVAEGAPVQITKDPSNKEHNFDRQNFRIGDAESRQVALVLNLDKPIDSFWEGGTFYSFLDFSNRQNTSAGFYRRANQLDRNPEGVRLP